MHHHYPTLTTALGLLGINLLAQPNVARPMKPAVSRNAAPTDIPLNAYKLPPFSSRSCT